jgi:hypothetical protein
MGIVRFALRFQHTFYVLALLMLFFGGSAIIATPKTSFPPLTSQSSPSFGSTPV